MPKTRAACALDLPTCRASRTSLDQAWKLTNAVPFAFSDAIHRATLSLSALALAESMALCLWVCLSGGRWLEDADGRIAGPRPARALADRN